MSRSCFIAFVCLVGVFTVVFSLEAQQLSGDEEHALNIQQLLQDALLFRADILVTSAKETLPIWKNKVDKLTIPGRAVYLDLKGEDGRLGLVFTIYATEDDKNMLVAKSETWFKNQYNSTLTSFPINYGDALYYYPLGRAQEGELTNPVEISMRIVIEPYLATLDEDSRKRLKSVLSSSSQFNVLEGQR